MKAYLYFYDIHDLNNFWGYFMDYAVYGQIYSFIPGFSTDFYEINFTPDDLLCYELNGYDPVSNPSSVPTFSTGDTVVNANDGTTPLVCATVVDPCTSNCGTSR
jgi:hypothetical protein